MEFWGDEIDSVSYFNTDTQRRTESVATVTLAPCVEVILDRPDLLAGRIGKLQSSLRGKNAPKAKAVLSSEVEKLENGLHLAL